PIGLGACLSNEAVATFDSPDGEESGGGCVWLGGFQGRGSTQGVSPAGRRRVQDYAASDDRSPPGVAEDEPVAVAERDGPIQVDDGGTVPEVANPTGHRHRPNVYVVGAFLVPLI